MTNDQRDAHGAFLLKIGKTVGKILIVPAALLAVLFLSENCDNSARLEVKAIAKRVVQESKKAKSRLDALDSLISAHGEGEEYPSATSPIMSRSEEKILKQLQQRKDEFNQFLQEGSLHVYDSTMLLYFCDGSPFIRNPLFSEVPDSAHPLAHLRVKDRDSLLTQFEYDFEAIDALEEYWQQLRYLESLEHMAFVHYTNAIFPHMLYFKPYAGAVSARVDVYQIDNQTLVDTFPVYAESSDSIHVFMIITEDDLRNDLERNLEKAVNLVLTRRQ